MTFAKCFFTSTPSSFRSWASTWGSSWGTSWGGKLVIELDAADPDTAQFGPQIDALELAGQVMLILEEIVFRKENPA